MYCFDDTVASDIRSCWIEARAMFNFQSSLFLQDELHVCICMFIDYWFVLIWGDRSDRTLLPPPLNFQYSLFLRHYQFPWLRSAFCYWFLLIWGEHSDRTLLPAPPLDYQFSFAELHVCICLLLWRRDGFRYWLLMTWGELSVQCRSFQFSFYWQVEVHVCICSCRCWGKPEDSVLNKNIMSNFQQFH